MIKKARLQIDGMHCTSCALNIDGDLEDMDGVKSSMTNYARQEVEVEYDADKVKVDTVIDQIQKTGYKAFVHPSNNIQK